jgi:hypothetical protein
MKLIAILAFATLAFISCETPVAPSENNLVNVSSSKTSSITNVSSSSETISYSSNIISYSSVTQYSSVKASSSSLTGTTSYPIDVTITYEAGANQTTGEFYIGYNINNYGKSPVKIVSAQYVIYGSAGGALNDITVTRDNLEYIWMNSNTYSSYLFEGYSYSYIPYSYKFIINFVDAQGKTKATTYSGVFKQFLSRKISQTIDTTSKAINLANSLLK